MAEPELDRRIRLKAFEHVLALERRFKGLAWSHLKSGFEFNGERIHLATKARGIFKPKQMSTLLSIKTVIPRPGRKYWYDDQRAAQQAIFRKDLECFDYPMMVGGPLAHGNVLLERAYLDKIPIIYFLGISPGRYFPIAPMFVYGWNAREGICRVGLGRSGQAVTEIIEQKPLEDLEQRRYYLSKVQKRAHQSLFRNAVILAYGGRCAISGLPEESLLDAAHIVEDKHEMLGQPVVCNGLPLSKIHHAAFDANLIAVDPDYRIHVADRLLDQNDGPMLDTLKGIHGTRIRPPSRQEDYPDPIRLEERFAQFRAAL